MTSARVFFRESHFRRTRAFKRGRGRKALGEEISSFRAYLFRGALLDIQDGLADIILAPIENSLAGVRTPFV